MDRLYEYMHIQLELCDSPYLRYMHSRINWDNRMLGLVGPRGVGKTTLFLQHLKTSDELDASLYVVADNIYFTDHTLFEVAENLNQNDGRFLYIDEIHKYPDWSRELKSIYDTFPDLHVYFTGSSVMDVLSGAYDLSRRAPQYHMQGLSFREWLGMRKGISMEPHSLEKIIQNKVSIPNVKHPLPLFREYLRTGYYPFGNEPDFPVKLDQVITQTLEFDIPQYAQMRTATARKLRKLMVAISEMAPFKPNMAKLASQVGCARTSLDDFLAQMDRAGMISLLEAGTPGVRAIAKPDKIYLDNTNIAYVMSNAEPDIGNVRETFFFNQARVDHRVASSERSDFEIDGITFEIGGRNKGNDQLKGIANGYVVRDEIEYGHHNVIPLWAFGLMY